MHQWANVLKMEMQRNADAVTPLLTSEQEVEAVIRGCGA